MHYKRIIAKFGTNLLTRGTDSLNDDIMSNLADQVARLHHEGHEILIVTSGAVAAGKSKLKLDKESKDIPFKQVLASLGQSRLMYIYEQLFGNHNINVAQALLTRADLISRAGYINARNTLLALIDLKIVCVINENDVVATEELAGTRFGDNDNLSAMVANLVDADLLVMLTDIDGLYTSDPHFDPGAELIKKVDTIDSKVQHFARKASSKAGTGGMITKIEAAKKATSCGITVAIANGLKPETLWRIAHNEDIGTIFRPCSSKMESKKRWMISGLASRGKLIIDNGAEEALKQQNKSLLPAGVIDFEGKFQRGDVVEILDAEHKTIGFGISNYNFKEVSAIKGSHSSEINQILGSDYGSEIVHKNNMVLIHET
jgi:glutamate 5-kinase